MESIDPVLPEGLAPIAARLAVEGIPVRAIARGLGHPAEAVYDALEQARATGLIIRIPKDDWPPTSRLADHNPGFQPYKIANVDTALLACRKLYKLTPLEAAFLVQLLQFDLVTKERLHSVIEDVRFARSTKPANSMETTDPKMVDVMICKLRQKIKKYDKTIVIQTVWGSGYYIEGEVRQAVIKTITATFRA